MNSTHHKPFISVISPVYGASSLLNELTQRIQETLEKITSDYEILLVEDHSPDNSWVEIQKLANKDTRIKGIKLSRNFGQQYAINCGLDHASGEWIFTLDCDLQDNPAEMLAMMEAAKKGFDVILLKRKNRQDSVLKKLFSWLFYKILSYLSGARLDSAIANFCLYHRSVVDAMAQMQDYNKYYPAMIHWVGFRQCILEAQHLKRKDGKETSYSFAKRMNLAINTILSFSNKPLLLTVYLGIFIVFTTGLMACLLTIAYVYSDLKVSGWMSLFMSIWFLSGIIICVLGMIGLYLGKTLDTVKNRPRYIVMKKVNLQTESTL